MKKVQINLKLDENLKISAKEVLKQVDLELPKALRLFLKKSCRRRRLAI